MVIFVKLHGGEAKSEVRIRAQFSIHSNHAKYVASIAFQKLHTSYRATAMSGFKSYQNKGG